MPCHRPLTPGTCCTALLLAFAVLWLPEAAAQPPIPGIIAAERPDKVANAPANPLAEQLSEARIQLQQALHSHGKQGESDSMRQRHPLLADKQRLLDWLVDLQREKVKRLEELETLQSMATTTVDTDPLVIALQGPAPYSAIQVDALRDEIDALQEKLAAAEAGYRAKQTELQNLNDQLKARAAVARRTSEPSVGSRTVEETEKAQIERDIASLLEKIAEVEISVTTLEQERLSLQMTTLRGRIEDLRAVLANVLPHQQLTQENLAAQRQRLRSEEERLTGEIERVSRRSKQYLAERAKLDDKGEASGPQAAFLEMAIKTDNAIRKGLDHLKILNGVSGDAWDKRHILLGSTDPQQRRAAQDALNELRQKIAEWRNLSRTRQDALRTEIRAQHIRIENMGANPREQRREKELLNLLLLQTETDERTELAAARLERQVTRWLADISGINDPQIDDRLAWLADSALRLAKRIWHQELFVAEDVSEVDGRQVSVKYGVTVGKSVGILVVFIVGYWLMAWISRLIQYRLVRWLKLSPQLASVIRRWAMIAFSIALVVAILNLARIPLSVFAFLGGALAIGFGFGAQTIIKNFISGLIVLFERKVRVGDVIELGGVTGRVTAVDLRATTVRAFNGVEALIPNANLIENQIINWTYSSRQIRRELPVDIAYETDVELAESLILATAAEHDYVLDEPAPEIFFDGFGDSALNMVLVYWVEFDGTKGPRRVDSDLRHEIYRRLSAAGISIPFPQQEVRVSLSREPGLDTASKEPSHA